MKKIGIIIFVITLAVGLAISSLFSFGRSSSRLFNVSFDIGSVKGSGQTGSTVRDISGFKAVDVGGIFEVEITAQKNFEVEIEADDNLLPFISTEVVNGTLKIETEKRLKTENPIKIRISAPEINNLDVSGVATVTLNNVSSQTLTIDASGASKLAINGSSTNFNVDTSGATKVDAAELTVNDASVDASGASHVNVHVTGRLNAEASGASKVLYTGTPASIDKDVSGAANVSAR